MWKQGMLNLRHEKPRETEGAVDEEGQKAPSVPKHKMGCCEAEDNCWLVTSKQQIAPAA